MLIIAGTHAHGTNLDTLCLFCTILTVLRCILELQSKPGDSLPKLSKATATMKTESSLYGSTRELMMATDSVEKADSGSLGGGCGGGNSEEGGSFKRRSILSRQRSSHSFEMGAKKIDQVFKFATLVSDKV